MVLSIERKCDRKKNPLFTISKKELISILKHKSVSKYVKAKSLKNKSKNYLCSLFLDLQNKLTGSKKLNSKKNNINNKIDDNFVNKSNEINNKFLDADTPRNLENIKIKNKTKKKTKFAKNKNLVTQVEVNKINKKHLISKNYQKIEADENTWGELQDCVSDIMTVFNIWDAEEKDEFLDKLDKDEDFIKSSVITALKKGVLRNDDYSRYTDDEIQFIENDNEMIDSLKYDLIMKIHLCDKFFD